MKRVAPKPEEKLGRGYWDKEIQRGEKGGLPQNHLEKSMFPGKRG